MNKILLLALFLLLISNISALCSEGQIDINTASLEKLDNLSGIGPIKAQAIIDTRPFSSVDDLIRVNGIGNVTLNNIKAQGLACVDSEEESNENNEENSNVSIDVEVNINQQTTNATSTNSGLSNNSPPVQAQVINLNPKDIKSESNSEKKNENYAIYGFIAFSILIVVLFMLRKNRYKNEFG